MTHFLFLFLFLFLVRSGVLAIAAGEDDPDIWEGRVLPNPVTPCSGLEPKTAPAKR